jgi:hypothetical protein
MIKIGFVILSHSFAGQLIRLARQLSLLFDDPPIVCHHDGRSRCPLDTGLFPPNVQFVRPSLVTSWGRISVVKAGLAALRLLINRRHPPDWFYLLSASDYPVVSPAVVRADLEDAKHDVFMEIRRITYELTKSRGDADGNRRWIRVAYDRYCALRIPVPSPKHPWRPSFLPIRNPAILGHLRFFGEEFQCYGGEHWFTANRKAVEWLLSEQPIHRRLEKHYKTRHCVDESYYHCVFGNNKHLRINPYNRRYIDWASVDKGRGRPHPKILDICDLPSILASSAHFARKFQQNSPVLDELDKHLGLPKWTFPIPAGAQ